MRSGAFRDGDAHSRSRPSLLSRRLSVGRAASRPVDVRRGRRFVVDWLNRPAPEYGRAPWLTRLAATLYRLRPDMQAAFPDVGGKHGKSYAHWFVEQAAVQERFPAMFVAPVQAALEGRRGASATAKASTVSAAAATGIRAETADGVPVVVHEEAERGARRPIRCAAPTGSPIAWRGESAGP